MLDLHQGFYDTGTGELDHKAFRGFVDELMEEFSESPEGMESIERIENLGWPDSMMDLALNYLGLTPAGMSAADIREVLFGLFPRKISVEPERAREIILELRAFWLFLLRHYDLKNAVEILAQLKDDAIPRLKKELADPRNYGIAKSIFMQGNALGFDMTSQKGLEEFMLHYNSRIAGRSVMPAVDSDLGDPCDFDDDFEEEGDYGCGTTAKERAEDRKRKRKATRRARKRNR